MKWGNANCKHQCDIHGYMTACLLHSARTGSLCSKRPSHFFVALLCCSSRQPHHQCPVLGMRSIESDHQRRSGLRVDNSCCPQCRVGEEHVRAARLVWTSKTKALGTVEKFDTREQCVRHKSSKRMSQELCNALAKSSDAAQTAEHSNH
jgi:hypothetical protein